MTLNIDFVSSSTFNDFASICALASVIGILGGITSSTVGLKVCVRTAGIKN